MHGATFASDSLYNENRLSQGLACKLASPPPVMRAKSQTGMAASFELHELSMIQSYAFSWGMQARDVCRKWNVRTAVSCCIEQLSLRSNSTWDTQHDENGLPVGLARKLALPAPVLPGKNQTGMAASFEVHELSMIQNIQSNASSWAREF